MYKKKTTESAAGENFDIISLKVVRMGIFRNKMGKNKEIRKIKEIRKFFQNI